MAIVKVGENWEGRGGSEDQKAVRTYRRVFRVQTDDAKDGVQTVKYAVDPQFPARRIPAMFDPYNISPKEQDLGAIVVAIDPVQDLDAPFFWTVTVEYSSQQLDPAQADPNPLNRPPVRRWSFAEFDQVLDRGIFLGAFDANNNAIAGALGTVGAIEPIGSSAREKFDPPITDVDGWLIYEVTRNEASFNELLAAQYRNALNNDVWRGRLPRQARVLNIGAEQMFENAITYFQLHYAIAITDEPWGFAVNLLDQGVYRLESGFSAALRQAPITRQPADELGNKLGNKQPISKPVLLDGKGGELVTTAAPVYRRWLTRKELPFAALNLP